MNNFIIYSIEIAIGLALFYTAYWIFLKKETFFKLNRFYLVASVVISLLIPLLNITIGGNSFITNYLQLPIDRYEQSIIGNIDSKYISERNEISIPGSNNYVGDNSSSKNNIANVKSDPAQTVPLNSKEESDSSKKINWLTITLTIYFIGAALFLIRFIANFIWIFGYALKHKPQQIFGMKVIRLRKNMSPFSFLNFIFMSQKEYPEAELTKIIAHEKVHIQQKHTIDLILFELLLVFQWFNPFIWFYKRAIKITHEYLADYGTLNSGVNLPDYQYSLLNQVLHENNFEIASSYNFSVKKRIAMMMQKRSSKFSTLKITAALPILIFLFSAFAFSTSSSEKDIKNNEVNKLISDTDTSIKRVDVTIEYLKLLEGEYVSTNEPGRVRRILFTEVLGTMHAWDNMPGWDFGYSYKIIPVGNGKFINPEDHTSFVFDTKDKNAISLLLFGRINLSKVKLEKNESVNRSKAFRLSMAFPLVNIMLKDGIPAALSYYKAAKDSIYLAEHEMNFAGYDLLKAGKTKEAAAIFELNTEVFPGSFNAYDSYAEALLVLGDKTKAIENFKESVKLNPGSKNGLKRLKELGVNTDELVKPIKISIEELKSLEGVYLSTNQPNWIRKITMKVEDGILTGEDDGYKYKLIPMGNGKFINPDDGASLVFDTKDRNAINLLLFGKINLKKIKPSKEPGVSIKNYCGVYLPSKKDSISAPIEIRENNNKLFRFMETVSNPSEKNIELEFVTDNLFFYTSNSHITNSSRSIEFIVNDKKEVTGCTIRRHEGTFTYSKKK